MARQHVAVIGASGFIGNRIVEILHLGGRHEVRPIARRASGLALASRFAITGRVADALDPAALADALRGCEVVVHAVAGNAHTVRHAVPALYTAAERAGCRRIVYLSSAMVHGQSPPAGCDEATPLSEKQPLPYNAAKVVAERLLFSRRRSGRVEAVALRPGIVYGPRSQWIGGLADQMLGGEAYLVDGGAGLCNAIYVDNLVDAVIRCFDAPEADGEAFLLGEPAVPTWRAFYERVAEAIGVDIADISSIGFEARTPGLKDRLDTLRQSAPVRAALSALPAPLARGLAAFWEASGAMPAATAGGRAAGPIPTLEMALLHRSRHVPSWEKARSVLGYEPPVSSEEAWHRTWSWLRFAGYPVPGEADE
jgi:nucleoside-diphosphate-sugar epimerase